MKRNTLFTLLMCFFTTLCAQLSEQDLMLVMNNTKLSFYQRLDSVDRLVRVYPCVERIKFHNSILEVALKASFQGDELATALAWNRRNAAVECRWVETHLEHELPYMDQALALIDEASDSKYKARIYNQYADMQIRNGCVSTGIDYFYRAIRLFETHDPNPIRIFDCLYQIAACHLQNKDTVGMQRVLAEMEPWTQRTDNYTVNHDYLAVKTAYMTTLHEAGNRTANWVDSCLNTSRTLIELNEKNILNIPRTVVVSWDYYNFAYQFHNSQQPHRQDSVVKYMQRALELRPNNYYGTEIEISINTFYLAFYLEQQEYDKVKSIGEKTLLLLKQNLDQNTILGEYRDTYQALAQAHRASGNYSTAYDYLLKEMEYERLITDGKKAEAMEALGLQFATEKKEAKIELLTQQQRVTMLLLILAIALIVILMVGYVALFLRRKNKEQAYYESALLQELATSETSPPGDVIIGLKNAKSLVESANIESDAKRDVLQNLDCVDLNLISQMQTAAEKPLSTIDVKYLLFFLAQIPTNTIAQIFNVEPPSVYTVRYRIRKKLKTADELIAKF